MTLRSKCSPFLFVCVLFLILNECSLAERVKHWDVRFFRFLPPIEIGEQKIVDFQLYNLNKTELIESKATIRMTCDSDIINAYKEIPVSELNNGEWNGSVSIDAIFIGGASIFVEIGRETQNECKIEKSKRYLPIQVVRKRVPVWMYNEIYILYENTLYFIIRALFGMVIDWREVAVNLRKPIGVSISFFCSYIFMPLASYALGFMIFPDSAEMQFALLVIGACVMKRVSNMWTVILRGNIHLSVMISLVHMLLACGMIPLWILTLGKTILPESQLKIQYYYFAAYIFDLVFPFCIGISIEFCIHYFCMPTPKKYVIKFLRILSMIYMASITIYAASIHYDLLTATFAFTWKYYLTGFLLPLLGYTSASLMAFAFKQNHRERIAIAVETINFSTIIASSTSVAALSSYSPRELALLLSNLMYIMAPVPLIIHFIWTKIRKSTGSIDISNEFNSLNI